jgi:hypothetical protein
VGLPQSSWTTRRRAGRSAEARMVVSELLVGEVNLNLMSKQEIESYLRDRYGEHVEN